MTNPLGIATVTAALQQRLIQAAATSGVPSPNITTLRPDLRDKDKKAGVNLYLYRVEVNGAHRNLDLPVRRSSGSLAQRPRLPLDLHYMISFYGEEKVLEPQRLMGAVLTALDARPTLTSKEIKDGIVAAAAGAPDGDPRRFLGTTDLAGEASDVRLIFEPLSLRDLESFWEPLGPPASLGAGLLASLVMLEPVGLTPQPALPVAARNVYVRPFREPRIDAVAADLDPALPILAGSTVRLSGVRLTGEITKLISGGLEFAPLDVGETQIRALLPAGLRVGMQVIQVAQKILMGDPPLEHRGFESNAAAFILSPTIVPGALSGVTSAGGLFTFTLPLNVTPVLRAEQRVTVLLNKVEGGADYAVSLPPLATDTAALAVKVEKIEGGNYYVRIQVDGAESPLVDMNPLSANFKQIVGPKITVS